MRLSCVSCLIIGLTFSLKAAEGPSEPQISAEIKAPNNIALASFPEPIPFLSSSGNSNLPLPPEIVLQIIHFASPSSLISLKGVNREFYGLINSVEVIKNYVKDDYKESLLLVASSPPAPIKDLIFKAVPEKHPSSPLLLPLTYYPPLPALPKKNMKDTIHTFVGKDKEALEFLFYFNFKVNSGKPIMWRFWALAMDSCPPVILGKLAKLFLDPTKLTLFDKALKTKEEKELKHFRQALAKAFAEHHNSLEENAVKSRYLEDIRARQEDHVTQVLSQMAPASIREFLSVRTYN